jgi:hypothetical protein
METSGKLKFGVKKDGGHTVPTTFTLLIILFQKGFKYDNSVVF